MTWNDWNPYRGIPFSLIAAVGIACFILNVIYDSCVVQKYRGKKKKEYRCRKWWIIATTFYMFTILCATYLGREPSEPEAQWEIFWTLKKALKTGEWRYWYFIIGNILLFVPLGYLLCHIFNGKCYWVWSVLFCLLFSCIIEAVQYFTGTGLCEMDDIFHNTVGGIIGSIIKQLFGKWVCRKFHS